MGKKALSFEIGNGTDVGRVRSSNEDSLACFTPANRKQSAAKGYLLLVCDGMGGAIGGKTASSMAAEAIAERYYRHKTKEPSTALFDAIVEANRRIFQRAQEEPELKGMGTTAVAAALSRGRLHLAHVGDSRCYLVRDGAISRLTEDHSLVNKMVRDGLITEGEARNHPEGHILSRSVGVKADVEVDVLDPPITLQSGDKIVLCSDGLSGRVEDHEILAAVESAAPQEAVNRLIAFANERGGDDNITVQIVRIGHHARSVKKATGATVIRSALRRPKRVRAWLMVFLFLVLCAAGLYLLWLLEIVDFRELLGQDWIPIPPEHLPPFK